MASKKLIFSIGAIALVTYLSMKTNKLYALTTANTLRGCDPLGCGSFGAKRGTRKHSGVDIKATPGESIYSPISGTITRIAYPYADDLSYKGVEIVNADCKVKIFYMTATVAVGSQVKAGQKIGVAQNISAKHGAAMTNHVHLEMYDKAGKLIDPTNLI